MSSNGFQYVVKPLQYNSECINFPEWISILTLCLAPLLVHIVSGAPPFSFLAHTRPGMFDMLTHYNPTSIIWRYAAITDRRLRAKQWTHTDLAAANAIFWTNKGWDGSEEMARISAPHCIRYPEHTYVRIFSIATFKTLITTLQGVAAVYTLVGSLTGLADVDFIQQLGVDMIFYPLAVIGLLRLCAGVWLTEEFEYALKDDHDATNVMNLNVVNDPTDKSAHGVTAHQSTTFEAFDPFIARPTQGSQYRRPGRSIPSILFRTVFFLIMVACLGLCSMFVAPFGIANGKAEFTLTSFSVGVFYLFLLLSSVIIYAVSLYRGQMTTTLLPCISKAWYKIYTLVVFAAMTALIVLASVETNRLPNGLYASFRLNVQLTCEQSKFWYIFEPGMVQLAMPVADDAKRKWVQEEFKGLTVGETTGAMGGINDTLVVDGGRYYLNDFAGYCVGNNKESKRRNVTA
ncbi:hypothetical protein BU24DRAFT_287178 [Aaosphaeria arxii CBS 175.79]|uniref:Uncharacterized protein n=1 Tax=Aaosphaeria arxii CBS 175.79 TaxID=1450172 RepID=A0A6A5XFT7_9PLEO|nr:uncharacterized protein BU24DRAFT_287178 [Aaosphaeria arxii CBS 175.79]KAF2011691.1 hypothetical protein BU24DRAFT_287178 [Aaosphaeria arxii CBS 175.79]